MCQAQIQAEIFGYYYSAFTNILIDLRSEEDFVFWLFNGDCGEKIIDRVVELGLKENEWYFCPLILLPIHHPSLMPSYGTA